MPQTKLVHALVAIDHKGKWIVYGFEDLETIEDLYETGVTEDLDDPLVVYRIKLPVEVPNCLEVNELQVAHVERVADPSEGLPTAETD